MAKVLITGGAGFIGANAARRFIDEGYDVRVLDDLSFGNLENVPSKAEFIHGSVTDDAIVTKSTLGADVVVHLAAWRSVFQSVEKPVEVNLVNAIGTLRILEAAKVNNVRTVLIASSSSVYGGADVLPTPESAPLRPKSPYAVSKIAAEYYAQVYAYLYGLNTICFRFFNIYGPLQDPNSLYAAVIPLFMEKIISGNSVEIHGDGKQTRDFTYVDDAVDAMLKVLAADSSRVRGKVYNIGAGSPCSIIELAELISQVCNKELNISYVNPRIGDVKHSYADVSAAKRDFGYNPRWKLVEGIQAVKSWFTSAKGVSDA